MVNHSLRGPAASVEEPAPCIGGVHVRDIRFASNREAPAGLEVRISDAGLPGVVRVRIRLPGTVALIELGLVPFINGVVVLPDDRVFSNARG